MKEVNRIRCAAIIPIGEGYVFMHRKNVKRNAKYKEYYTFPGGGLEEGETLEQCTIREVKEEFGINIKVIKKIYELENEELSMKEYFFLCEYIDGEFGTGTGEEFSNSERHANAGEYIPEIVKKENIKNITLLPPEIAKRFIADFI